MDLENKAVILSDGGTIKTKINYAQVYKYTDLITDFLKEHISTKHQCIGLKMVHNIYIPSLILSLQKLEHCFIFMPEENADNDKIKQLGICWVLSFNIGERTTAQLLLDDNYLSLEQHNNNFQTFEDIFYVICTSGTTGESKFVKVSKFSIETNIRCLSNTFDIQSNDVIYWGTPLTFDPSMVELLLALHNGACLLITCNPQMNPIHQYQTLFDPKNGVTVLQIVPSLFLRWNEQQIRNILMSTRLKILAFGGESFPQSILKYKRSENLRIFNLYGITEVSCWASIYEVGKQDNEVPLGVPLDDTEIEVRDDRGNKITEGEGEIYIGSETRVCWVNNESHKVFQATGDIGNIRITNIFYKGRKNETFKRFGHKLSLSKLEEMITKETQLPNKCIWLKSESKLLVFLIIDNIEFKIKDKILDKIRVKLLHGLPNQYFPDYIDSIRKIPVTSHGKTNKRALEALYLSRNKDNKGNAVDTLTSLFCKYFGLDHTTLESLKATTFFQLGGNSILAVQFLNDFHDIIGQECPDLVSALFEKNIGACLECVRRVTVKKRTKTPIVDHSKTIKKIKSDIKLKINWSHNLEACVDSSPLVFHHGERIFVAVGGFSHIFIVLDVTNGAQIARFVLPNVIEASPCISPCQSFLYVGCFDGCLYCLDFMGGSIKWVYSTSDRIKCKPVVCQESKALVFGSYDKHVHCVSVVDGSLVWKIYVQESITATPLVYQKKILIATICGTCLGLSETDGEILWKYKSSSPIFGTPCIINETIIYPNVNGTLLFLTCDGHQLQRFECRDQLFSSLIIYKKFLIFGCGTNLYVLEFDNGVPKCKVSVDLNDVLSTPFIRGDQIAVTGNSGQLFLLDFEGRLLGDMRLPGEVFSSIVGHETKLFVGCRDNNLYCIEIET